MSPYPQPAGAEDRRRTLRRKKAMATAALLVSAGAFVAGLLLRRHGWSAGLLAAAGEAGMVGGLADWFAITALFRRPLGLPIPHTALIPTRKDEIGRSMARFIEENFLDPPVILARLREENRAIQIGRWLVDPHTSQALAGNLLDVVPHLVATIDDGRVRLFLTDIVRERVSALDLVPAARQLVATLLEEGRHLEIMDAVVAQFRTLPAEYRDSLVGIVGLYTGRYMPSFIDRRLASGVVQGVEGWMERLMQPDSTTRGEFDVMLRSRIEAFLESPEFPEMLAAGTYRLAANPAFQGTVSALWDELKQALLIDAARTPSKLGGAVAELVSRFGRLLASSAEMQSVLNGAIERVVVVYLVPWRAEIGAFIAAVVRRWDGRRIAEIIELQVGSDLQFVRINGTVIGALVGALLYMVSLAITRQPPF